MVYALTFYFILWKFHNYRTNFLRLFVILGSNLLPQVQFATYLQSPIGLT